MQVHNSDLTKWTNIRRTSGFGQTVNSVCVQMYYQLEYHFTNAGRSVRRRAMVGYEYEIYKIRNIA